MSASTTDIVRPTDSAHKPTTLKPSALRPIAGFHFGLNGAEQDFVPAQGSVFYRNIVKRLFDVIVILLAAPVAVPLIAVLALIVALTNGRPFYSQSRVGRGGKIYTMWKLRSMIHDADLALDAHLAANADARAEWDLTQKLKCDPRITGFGRILRKTSLDELPQLWNVFIGDMSLVGPRPMMPSQRSLYPGHAYYRLRPGITGMWQVSARNESTFADRAGFDAAYDQTVSLATDLSLLKATIWVVLRGTGH